MSIEEQREAEESMQDHQANLSQAQQMAPSFGERREYLEAVIDDELDDATVDMLRNMTSRDFILSNLQDPEINEIKKLREITLKKVKAAHPNQNTAMTGDLREEVYDGGNAVEPLDSRQKILVDQYLRAAFTKLARSRDGFQQEEFGKTISASERRANDNDNGGLLSFS